MTEAYRPVYVESVTVWPSVLQDVGHPSEDGKVCRSAVQT